MEHITNKEIREIQSVRDKIHRFGLRKLTSEEAYKRDKAVFIDFLHWSGERKDFCQYAAEKYDTSVATIYKVLKYCLYSDPKRYEMV